MGGGGGCHCAHTCTSLPRRRHQVGVTHYFKMDKARRVLGYEVIVPHPVGMERTVARWAGWHQMQNNVPSAASAASRILVMLALAVVVVAMIAVVVMQLLGVTQPSLVSVPLLSDW
jgi:hypothetical protein